MSPLDRLDTARFYATLELLRPLPLDWVFRVLRAQARVSYRLRPRKRRQAMEWLREMAPADQPDVETTRLARQLFAYATFKRYLNYLLFLHDAKEHRETIAVEGWHRVEEALGQKQGVILLSSHVGLSRVQRWFLRTKDHRVYYLLRIAFPSATNRSPAAIIARWHRNRYRLDADELFGNEELSVQYMKKAYDHLRRNGIVTIAGDGHHGSGPRHPVTICGRQHELADGGISLALMTGAAILPCFVSVDDAPRFRLEFQEPLTCPSGDRGTQTQALAEAYAERIAGFVSRHPTNVPNFRYSVRLGAARKGHS